MTSTLHYGRTIVRTVTVALILFASPARAQTQRRTAITLDPRVDAVASGGFWESGKTRGRFRVVVIRQGQEEIRRLARVEWIQEFETRRADVVVKQLDLTDRADVFALADPVIERRGTQWIVRLKSSPSPTHEYDGTVEFTLGTPGSVTLLRRQ